MLQSDERYGHELWPRQVGVMAMNSEIPPRKAVIKVGGDVLLTKKGLDGLAQNTRSLIDDGWSIVVLHGGGPQISRLQQLHGLTPR